MAILQGDPYFKPGKPKERTCMLPCTFLLMLLLLFLFLLLCTLPCVLLFSGFECWIENRTVYAPESGGRTEVKINPKDSVELPVGEYLFKTLYGDKMCGYFVNVKGE